MNKLGGGGGGGKYDTVQTVPKFNWKIVDIAKMDTP